MILLLFDISLCLIRIWFRFVRLSPLVFRPSKGYLLPVLGSITESRCNKEHATSGPGVFLRSDFQISYGKKTPPKQVGILYGWAIYLFPDLTSLRRGIIKEIWSHTGNYAQPILGCNSVWPKAVRGNWDQHRLKPKLRVVYVDVFGRVGQAKIGLSKSTLP